MKTVNIYDFFPISDEETLERYLRPDSEYEDRKNQLCHVLLKCIPEDAKKFPTAMLSSIFDTKYMETHRWPTVKYVY